MLPIYAGALVVCKGSGKASGSIKAGGSISIQRVGNRTAALGARGTVNACG